MVEQDHPDFPPIVFEPHLIGFKNGVFNIKECQFVNKVKPGTIVRKYFDVEYVDELSPTPLFDTIIKNQFPDNELFQQAYSFLLMCIGRMFFDVGELDNWGFMLFLLGKPGTGKSTLINFIKRMFNNVGTIIANFESKFGLSAIYNKELVLGDDLPDKISKVFRQTTFQSCITGEISLTKKEEKLKLSNGNHSFYLGYPYTRNFIGGI